MNQEHRASGALARPISAQSMRNAIVRADHRVVEFTRERPVVAAFLAVGAGYLLGRLVSRSRRW
jgi:hypothetical protein